MNSKISIISLFFIICIGCGDKRIERTFFDSGKLKEEYSIDDKGERDGSYVSYFSNGDTSMISSYLHGSKNGLLKEYYPGNKLKAIMFFEDNLKQGGLYVYDSLNGSLIRKGKFLNDKYFGLFRKYKNGTLTDLLQMYNDSLIWSVSGTAKNGDEFKSVKNYIDIDYPDTVKENAEFIAKIQLKNCTFESIVFYEGDVLKTENTFILRDTINTYKSINDSLVVYKRINAKKGINIFKGILYAKEQFKDTVLNYPYVIIEQFFVK